MRVLGAVWTFFGILLNMATLPTLGDNLRGWGRWAQRLRRSEYRRWIVNIVGLVLLAMAPLFGLSPWVPFVSLMAVVLVGGALGLAASRRGLPNWRACQYGLRGPDWPFDMKDALVFLIVQSRDGSEMKVHKTTVRHKALGVATLDQTENVFAVQVEARPESKTYFPGHFTFEDGKRPKDRLQRGKYTVEWWALAGVGETLVRKSIFRVGKDGQFRTAQADGCPSPETSER